MSKKHKDISQGNGFGFILPNNHICMIRCFNCGRENYAMAVTSGFCSWCGFNANPSCNTFDTVDSEKEKGET